MGEPSTLTEAEEAENPNMPDPPCASMMVTVLLGPWDKRRGEDGDPVMSVREGNGGGDECEGREWWW